MLRVVIEYNMCIWYTHMNDLCYVSNELRCLGVVFTYVVFLTIVKPVLLNNCDTLLTVPAQCSVTGAVHEGVLLNIPPKSVP